MRGATPRPRSGAEAGRTPCPNVEAEAESARLQRRRNGREEELPKSEVRGGGREEITHVPKPEARGGGQEELPHAPTLEARSGGREDQPHVQGAVAVRVQEGLEELSHIEGQEGRR